MEDVDEVVAAVVVGALVPEEGGAVILVAVVVVGGETDEVAKGKELATAASIARYVAVASDDRDAAPIPKNALAYRANSLVWGITHT